MNTKSATPIDKIDKSIIQILQNDGRVSSDKLARQLNVSSASVRRRIRTLVRDDIIRIVAIPELKKIGINLMVGIHIEISPKTVDIAIKELARHKAVKCVGLTTGRFNCVAIVVFSNTEEYQDFMRSVVSNIKGLINVESFIFLEFKKGCFTHGG